LSSYEHRIRSAQDAVRLIESSTKIIITGANLRLK